MDRPVIRFEPKPRRGTGAAAASPATDTPVAANHDRMRVPDPGEHHGEPVGSLRSWLNDEQEPSPLSGSKVALVLLLALVWAIAFHARDSRSSRAPVESKPAAAPKAPQPASAPAQGPVLRHGAPPRLP